MMSGQSHCKGKEEKKQQQSKSVPENLVYVLWMMNEAMRAFCTRFFTVATQERSG